MARREFTKSVYRQIVKRAFDPARGFVCEGCGLVLGKKPYHIDHTIPDALVLDKSRPLTADDGKLLGVECCHGPKTRQIDVPAIAKAKRREDRKLGIVDAPKLKGAPFAKTRKSARREKHAAEVKQLAPRRLFALWHPGHLGSGSKLEVEGSD